MGLVAWIKSKFVSKENGEEMLQKLREEIYNLKKENETLKKKVINEEDKITIEFFDEKIEEVIIDNIRGAEKEIYIAMAWFTSEVLMNELEKLKNNKVDIKIIISDDESNMNNGNMNKLTNICKEIKTVTLSNNKYKNLMHNKYCIIDNKKVIDGSYNWSKNAKYNLEHIIVIESEKVAKMYKANFNNIYYEY